MTYKITPLNGNNYRKYALRRLKKHKYMKVKIKPANKKEANIDNLLWLNVIGITPLS